MTPIFISRGKVEQECPICKNRFIRYKSFHSKYCSRECSNRSRPDRGKRIVNECVVCKKKYTPIRRGESGRNQEYCSRDCRVKGKSKENHWNWKGGIAVNHRRETKEYIEWRSLVYRRDNWTCKKCGLKCRKENIVAHHIKTWSEYPELRFEVSNGIVLCRSCHKKTHKEIGFKKKCDAIR